MGQVKKQSIRPTKHKLHSYRYSQWPSAVQTNYGGRLWNVADKMLVTQRVEVTTVTDIDEAAAVASLLFGDRQRRHE